MLIAAFPVREAVSNIETAFHFLSIFNANRFFPESEGYSPIFLNLRSEKYSFYSYINS